MYFLQSLQAVWAHFNFGLFGLFAGASLLVFLVKPANLDLPCFFWLLGKLNVRTET